MDWRGVVFGAAIGAMAVSKAAPVIPLVTGEWPPFVSQSAPDMGPVTEIVRMAMKEAGYEVSIQFVSWPIAEAMVEKGSVFAAFPYLKTDARLARFEFSDTLLTTTGRLFFFRPKWSSRTTYARLEELRPYTLGVIRGEWYLEEFGRLGLSLDYATTEAQSIAKLRAGRVDLVPVNDMVGWHHINMQFPKESASFGVLEPPLNLVGHNRLLVSRSYPESRLLMQQFNDGLSRIRANGVYDRILIRHGLTGQAPVSVDAPIPARNH